MSDSHGALDDIVAALRQQNFAGAGQLIERALDADPNFAAGRNALLAHWLVLAARWSVIERLLPSGTNSLQSSGWLNSLFVSKPVNAVGAPLPWLTYPAIEFLEPRIGRDWRVFEWGSGYSTLWWASRVAAVRAVEHDAKWFGELKPRLPANAQVELVSDLAGYPAGIADAGGPFDVVVIDGEMRNACAAVALDHVKPDGLIVFDNSDRKGFRDGLERLGGAGWRRLDFFGLIPSYLYKNCTSVFFRDDRFVTGAPLPCDATSSVGPTCAMVMGE